MTEQNEYNVIINGSIYRVVEIDTIQDITNPDHDERLVWLRKHAPGDKIIAAVKQWGISHVLGGTGEDDLIAIPLEQASEELLQLAELLRPKRQGDQFFKWSVA